MTRRCNNCANSMYNNDTGETCGEHDCWYVTGLKKWKPVGGDLPRYEPLKKKLTNPKDVVGIRKWRQFCTVPFTVIWHIGVAMLEGACKYGRHNYRDAGVCASVYIDAAMGHITQWWEGEDIDADSGLCHIDKALASLCVLRDGMLQNNYNDDRPLKSNLDEIRSYLQRVVEEIQDRYPEKAEPFTELKHGKSESGPVD